MNNLKKHDNLGFIPLIGLVILLAVAIIAAGAIIYVVNMENTNTNSNAIPTNWEKYTNMEYGYSFQYPPQYHVTDVQRPYGNISYDGASLVNDSGRGFMVTAFPLNGATDAETAFQSATNINLSETKRAPITIAGITGTWLQDVPGSFSYDAAYIAHGQYSFELMDRLDQAIWNQILSTFEFTE